jgi:hypothetical protein
MGSSTIPEGPAQRSQHGTPATDARPAPVRSAMLSQSELLHWPGLVILAQSAGPELEEWAMLVINQSR